MRYEDFIPMNSCYWVYDKYPELRNDSKRTVDEVIIAAYVENIMQQYGDGNSLTYDQLTNYLRELSQHFNADP